MGGWMWFGFRCVMMGFLGFVLAFFPFVFPELKCDYCVASMALGLASFHFLGIECLL